jgi:glyoxylase-like metal-dependent hydrolase (beta-lactamase superfamily II)
MMGSQPSGMVRTVVEKVSPRIRRIVAPNPGPFTHTGTCAYVVSSGDVAIIDPGPADDNHVAAMLAAVAEDRLRYILVTHTHRDHSPAARLLAKATGALVVGCAPYVAPADIGLSGSGFDAAHDRDYAPDIILAEGDRLSLGDSTLETFATPGHTANHLCFALLEERALFTGDHVMRWSTTVIAPPDGCMRDYMLSLERQRLRDDLALWPAHGDPIRRPQRYLRALYNHRRAREASILQRIADGDHYIHEIVQRIYAGIDPRLHGAAAMTVFAHIEDLNERGLVCCEGPSTMTARYFSG